MTTTLNGFIAEDLEESVAATGCGEGVVVDGVTVGTIVATTVITVSIIYDTHRPTLDPPMG